LGELLAHLENILVGLDLEEGREEGMEEGRGEEEPYVIREAVKKQDSWHKRFRGMSLFLWDRFFSAELWRLVNPDLGPSKELILRTMNDKNEGKTVDQAIYDWRNEIEDQRRQRPCFEMVKYSRTKIHFVESDLAEKGYFRIS